MASLNELQTLLLQQPTKETRTEIAQELAHGLNEHGFNATERLIVTEIIRLMINDAEVQVRKMLSEQLASNIEIPHDIIDKLAHDISEVALPVLEKSYVLSEEDLVAIVESTKDIAVMAGIARRETVSRDLSEALLKKSNVAIIEILLKNKSAVIDDNGLDHIFKSFPQTMTVLELMVKRGGLPVTLAEKLFLAVTDEMKTLLTGQYKLSVEIAGESTKSVQEFATLGFLDEEMRDMDMSKLINHLFLQGRLTLSIIIRALCLGNIQFFEAALAKLADVPLTNAQLLIFDQSEKGFESLYKTSCLPMELFPATQYLLKTALEETGYGRFHRADFKSRMIERLMRDDGIKEIEYMDYLLTLFQNNVTDVALAS